MTQRTKWVLAGVILAMCSCGGGSGQEVGGRPQITPKPVSPPGTTPSPTPTPEPAQTRTGDLRGGGVGGVGSSISTERTEHYQLDVLIGATAPIGAGTSENGTYEFEDIRIEDATQ